MFLLYTDTNFKFQDLQSIVKMFLSSLHNATKGRRILIILDGLDELPKSNLLWLPRELPDHVRIILTTLTNGGYYNGLKVLSSSLVAC
jgi:hypothetical protein